MTTLTSQQLRVIIAITSGSTVTQAAAAEKIHRNTITNWRRTNPDFARELQFATQKYSQHWNDQLTALLPEAVQAIEDCLTDPKSSPSLRFRAAALILKMATQSKLASFIPTAQNAPEIEKPAQECTTEPELASFIPDPEAANNVVHAQIRTKPQPIRATPQPGRNEPCPCKSGLKFKRCCLIKREAARHLTNAA